MPGPRLAQTSQGRGELPLVFPKCPSWGVSDEGSVLTGGEQTAGQTSGWLARCRGPLARSHTPPPETCKVLGPWEGHEVPCPDAVVPRGLSPSRLWEK